MAVADTDIGTGAQVDFGTSTNFNFSVNAVELLSANWNGISNESIETTHMESSNARTFMTSDLYDPGTIDLEWHFETDSYPPNITTGAEETVTITLPDGTTWSAQCFMTDFSFSVPLEDKMVATGTLKVTGEITIA